MLPCTRYLSLQKLKQSNTLLVILLPYTFPFNKAIAVHSKHLSTAHTKAITSHWLFPSVLDIFRRQSASLCTFFSLSVSSHRRRKVPWFQDQVLFLSVLFRAVCQELTFAWIFGLALTRYYYSKWHVIKSLITHSSTHSDISVEIMPSHSHRTVRKISWASHVPEFTKKQRVDWRVFCFLSSIKITEPVRHLAGESRLTTL